jgi:inositol polyphosphate 5-phosphatase INPP5B/F
LPTSNALLASPHHHHQASLFVGSWNVNAKGKEEPLDQWLRADWAKAGLPDIVAVGFQEIVDLNAVNVAVDNKTQQRSHFWIERLASTLNAGSGNDPNRQYVMLMQKSMVGLLICVFSKQVHESRVKYVNASSVGVGVMGMMGNKGGVSIRMQFYDSTFCFVCSHLAAHRENVTGRNADFANVSTKTTFDVGEAAIREVIRSGSLSHWAIGSSAVGLPDHDHIFWMGDLNYRIDDSVSTERVLHLSEKGVLAELRQLDQLNMERAGGRAFDGYEEGMLHFPPTYKYQPGTDVYEQRPDKKLRAPAWCDRILWKSQEFSHVQQLTYARAESPNVSDHKAVYSTMRVTIKDVIQAKREAIYDELMAVLDRYENQTLPVLGLDRVSLDFGEIRYDESLSLPIQITNTGTVVAQFRFVPKPEEVRFNLICVADVIASKFSYPIGSFTD